MEVDGWRLYAHPLFLRQLEQLKKKVAAAAADDPGEYRSLPAAKLLTTIYRLVRETIPANPSAAIFRQGNTLGKDNRHWFRAKFHVRYRLFFRFSSKEKVIVYAWVNDERTLRQSGAKTDPYSLFRAMLEAGDPPESMEALMTASERLEH